MENIEQSAGQMGKNKKTRNFVIFISIVAILAIAGGFYYYFKVFKNQNGPSLSVQTDQQQKMAQVVASDKYFNFIGAVSGFDKNKGTWVVSINSVHSFAKEFPQTINGAKLFNFEVSSSTDIYSFNIASSSAPDFYSNPSKYKKSFSVNDLRPGITVQIFVPLAEGAKADNFQASRIFIENPGLILSPAVKASVKKQ